MTCIQRYLPFIYISLVLCMFGSCKPVSPVVQKESTSPIKTTSPHTQQLYKRIRSIAKKGYAFGHQDATAYGIHWKNDGNLYKSDVYDVVGDFPAVHGFEIGHI
ncbi:MAG: endoglucanase, partial [Bacteroidota bacterium]